MSRPIVAGLIWVVGIPLVIIGVPLALYAWEEYQWRRDQKQGERRLILLINLQDLDDHAPPHDRRHQ